MLNRTIILALVLLPAIGLWGQFSSPEAMKEAAYRQAEAVFPEYLDFLRIPNDARSSDMDANMAAAEEAFRRRGFDTQRLPTGGLDWVYAEKRFPGAKETVLFYMHIDGQAVDRSKWEQDDPYEPVIKALGPDGKWEAVDGDPVLAAMDKEWRIFGRSSADAKGPVYMFLAAFQAMEAAGARPNYHIKVIMDSEEEASATHLDESVARHKEVLSADKMIILDGPVHLSGKPTLVFGARGIASVRITTYGPRSPQHSGHYGNYAPNPALRLAQLLASMKDEDGRVTIPGYYDGIELDAATRNILAGVPDDEAAIMEKIGIAGTDEVGANLQEALQYPSLNIRGMAAAWVGAKVRTIIPDAAVAHLDIRLVKESDPDRLIRLIREHIESKGYHILEGEPTEAERRQYPRLLSMSAAAAYPAFRTDLDSEIGRWLSAALTHTYGQEPVRIRTMGGSVPISPFVNILETPAVILPLVNPDNNQHSPNENLRVGNFYEGARALLGVLLERV